MIASIWDAVALATKSGWTVGASLIGFVAGICVTVVLVVATIRLLVWIGELGTKRADQSKST